MDANPNIIFKIKENLKLKIKKLMGDENIFYKDYKSIPSYILEKIENYNNEHFILQNTNFNNINGGGGSIILNGLAKAIKQGILAIFYLMKEPKIKNLL